ncbi:WhiB family transcriptional regulator [Rhodococcus sp. WS4]|nr:WhiB family transcriptional regulator [Rhodococcus sp. WS4]
MLNHSHHHINPDWQHRASCRGTDTEMFFSPDGERGSVRAQREHAAKRICHDCPVLVDCRAHALTATEAYGIWGGMSESERARHTRRTRLTARPRKCAAATNEQSWPPTTHRDLLNPTRRIRPSNS